MPSSTPVVVSKSDLAVAASTAGQILISHGPELAPEYGDDVPTAKTFAAPIFAPTAAAGTATDQVATTEFVDVEVAGVASDLAELEADVAELETRVVELDQSAVHITGDQTVGGVKTFTSAPVVPTLAPGAATDQAASPGFVAAGLTDLAALIGQVNDAAVHLTGDQTIAGVKAFTSAPTVPTLAPGTATTQTASTAFVDAAVGGVETDLDALDAIVATKAPLASPAFTGNGSITGTFTATGGFVGSGSSLTGVVLTSGVQSVAGAKTFTELLTAQGTVVVNATGVYPIRIGTTGAVGETVYSGIWITQAAPSLTNYTLLHDSTTTILNAPAGEMVSLRVANVPTVIVSATDVSLANGRPLAFTNSSSTTANRTQATLTASWAVATDATRRGRVVCSVYDATATREAWRSESTGSAAALGFYGAAAVAKPTVTGSRAGGDALASLLTALATLGLITDSTTA